ncbi:hypothetical protein Ancab_036358 [Ancistrocladus abbreviatus]
MGVRCSGNSGRQHNLGEGCAMCSKFWLLLNLLFTSANNVFPPKLSTIILERCQRGICSVVPVKICLYFLFILRHFCPFGSRKKKKKIAGCRKFLQWGCSVKSNVLC